MTESFDVIIHQDVAFDVPLGQPGTPGTPGGPGAPGAAATVTVGTVTTGAPGTDAEVENVGTSSAAVFNFTIPRGDQGDPGSGGGGAWGGITGILSDQTDLQTELDGKADVGHTHTAADVTDFDAEVSGNADVAANTSARHTHANAAVLNATTASFLIADETKLDGIAAGATANSSDATLLARANHTGTQSADTLTDGTTNKAFLAAERTKLAGVATGATANDTDANLKARGNHTGTQLASTISDFNAAAFPAGSANNPHTTKGAARNSALPKNFWRYAGTAPADNPTNWVDGDEWITV